MSTLNIIKEPDPFLRQISKPVKEFTPRIHEILDDMADTMERKNGIGIAAVQVGILYRIAILKTHEFGNLEIINPEILEESQYKMGVEGCLSCPNKTGKVKRPHKMKLSFFNRNKERQTAELKGLDAVIASHEIDHLNGILFIDKLENG
ncbi:MAG: peptide deformylase [Christensenellaceae bacterium]|jgi:peptide deformylase|nr:peptide deformylase [Christensenellaceae bacterium]